MQGPGPWVAGLRSLAVAWWSAYQEGGLRQGPRGLESQSSLNRVRGTELSSKRNLEHPSERSRSQISRFPFLFLARNFCSASGFSTFLST